MSSERPVPWAHAPVATTSPRIPANTLIAKRMEHPPNTETRALPGKGIEICILHRPKPHDSRHFAPMPQALGASGADDHEPALGLRATPAGTSPGRVPGIDLGLEQIGPPSQRIAL